MLDSNAILQLYANVLHEDVARSRIREQDIKRGVQNMAHVYAPKPDSLQAESVDVANYNDAAHRCAYLHKYAAFHTAMVQDMMFRILEQKWERFKYLTASENFRICSLGGGPGSDVIGVIAALSTYFGAFKTNVTVVDIMEQWEYTFSSVIAELKKGSYGMLQTNFADNFLQWTYVGANLLDKMTNPVNKAIAGASLVTMVKFISATACQDTDQMIKKIFRCMKPGALLLFIDNAAGGFHGLIQKAARENRFNTVFGPLYHNTYINETQKVERFGYTSCFTTTVTVHLLLKQVNPQRAKQRKNIPVSPQQQNLNIPGDVTLHVQPVNEANTSAVRQFPNNSMSFFKPVYTNEPSRSNNTGNLCMPVHPKQTYPARTTYDDYNRTSPRSQGNMYNPYRYTPVPSCAGVVDSTVSPPHRSNEFRAPEENSDACCSCCVVS